MREREREKEITLMTRTKNTQYTDEEKDRISNVQRWSQVLFVVYAV